MTGGNDLLRFDQAAFDRERAAIFSSAIGMARLCLRDGDAEGALKVLDSAFAETTRLHREALLTAGYSPSLVKAFLGGSDE